MPTDPIIIIMDGCPETQSPASGDVQYASGSVWVALGLILIVAKLSVKLRKRFDFVKACR